MSLLVRRLCRNIQKDYRINLIAGAEGLDNKVVWVHMIEDCEVAEFLHGNEVILSTGIGNLANDTKLMEFVKKLHSSNASAVMINIGPYIKSIPKEIIDYCNEVKLPLYTIPWEVKLVDLTRKFCQMLIESEEKEKSLTSLVKDYLFKPQERDKVYGELTRNGFAQHLNYCVIISGIVRNGQLSTDSNDKELLHGYLEREIGKITNSYCIFQHDNKYACIIAGVNTSLIKELVKVIDKKSISRQGKIHLAVSNNRENLFDMPKNFELADRMFKLIESLNQTPLIYDDLGIYKILLSVSEQKVMKDYEKEVIGALEEYDEGNGTDFMDFIRIFIKNGGNIQQVANAMYVHRNTIHYKINRIKEISGLNLSELDDILKVALCLQIMNLR